MYFIPLSPAKLEASSSKFLHPSSVTGGWESSSLSTSQQKMLPHYQKTTGLKLLRNEGFFIKAGSHYRSWQYTTALQEVSQYDSAVNTKY